MAVDNTNLIGEAEFTQLRSGVVKVLGTPTGSTESNAFGYNQSVGVPSVSPNQKITAAQWNALITDVNKCFTHQAGSGAGLPTLDADDKITATIYNDIETKVDFIQDAANRFSVGSGQSTPTTIVLGTQGSGWNGTRTMQFVVNFSNSNNRKAFFNAGGTLKFVFSLSYSGSEAKTVDWKTMMSDMGDVVFNYADTFVQSGTGVSGKRASTSSRGFYDIVDGGNTFNLLASKGGSTPYSENIIDIYARNNSATQLEFRVRLRDLDVGDDRNPGADGSAPVDENVKGTTTIRLYSIRPSDAVSVPAPTVAAATGNTISLSGI